MHVLVQTLVSFGLLAVLVHRVSWHEVGQMLSNASPTWMAISGGMYYVAIGLSCLKWQLALRVEQIDVPWHQLYRWYLIGMFANNFLPSDVGGDLGRGYYAVRYTGQSGATMRSIIVERGSGFAALLVLATIGVVAVFGPLAVLIVVAGLLLAILLWRKALWRRIPLPKRLQQLLPSLGTHVRLYLRQPMILVALGSLSLIFHLLSGLGYWSNIQAVHVQLPLVVVVLIAAMTNVLGALPISINGWGVREAAFIGLLAVFQIPTTGVLAGLLLGRALTMLFSLPGIVPLVLERKRRSVVEHFPPNQDTAAQLP